MKKPSHLKTCPKCGLKFVWPLHWNRHINNTLEFPRTEKWLNAVTKGIQKARQKKNWSNRGYKWTEEQRKKLSLSCIGRTAWNKGLTKNTDSRVSSYSHSKNWSKEGKLQLGHWTRTVEYRKSVSNLHKTDKRLLSVALANLRNAIFPVQDTRPEVIVQESLAKSGITFFTHVRILNSIPDIIIPDKRVAIFVDGCYWHGCPIHYSNDYFIQRKKPISEVRQRDKIITNLLTYNNWKVIRVWECQLKKDRELVVSMLKKNDFKTVVMKYG